MCHTQSAMFEKNNLVKSRLKDKGSDMLWPSGWWNTLPEEVMLAK